MAQLPKGLEPLTYQNITDFKIHEFQLLFGVAGTGKTEALLKTAEYWQDEFPGKRVFAIDTESRMVKAFRLRYQHLHNLHLFHGEQCSDITKFLKTFDAICPIIEEGELLQIESDTRIWDLSQDEAWLEVTGQSKNEYLAERQEAPAGKRKDIPVTPMPENLWQVAGNYYRRRYRQQLDILRLRCNIQLTTGLSVPKDKGKQKISEARKETMALLGTEIAPDGHAEVSRNPDTVIWMTKDKDGYKARVLKDQSFDVPGEIKVFTVSNSSDGIGFYGDFIRECRSGK